MLTVLTANITGMTLAGRSSGCSKILCVEVGTTQFFTQILNKKISADFDVSLFEEILNKSLKRTVNIDST